MKNLKKILNNLNEKLVGLCIKLIECITSVSKVISNHQQEKKNKELKKQIKKNEKEIDEICDNGQLQDLLDKFTKATVIILTACMTGCSTQLQVTTTNSWEGHYMNVKDFNSNTKDIQLRKNESIWVLSNTTLKKILKEKQ